MRPVYVKDSNELVNLNKQSQHVRVLEVQQLFFKHIRETIFKLAEPRTLLGHLQDYQGMLRNYGFDADGLQTKMVKSMLLKEFGDKIGFQERYHKKQSIIVYYVSASGDNIEVAINA